MRRAIPTPTCAHGVDFPDTRCGVCMDINDDERWAASEKRQIDADQFALDMRNRGLDQRVELLTAKLAARALVALRGAKP